MGWWSCVDNLDSVESHATMGARADFCVCARQCPAICITRHGGILGPTWWWYHGLVCYEFRHEPSRTCLGLNFNLDPRPGSLSFPSDRIASGCSPRLASSSDDKGGGTGKKPSSMGAGCCRCYRGTHALLLIELHRLLYDLSIHHGRPSRLNVNNSYRTTLCYGRIYLYCCQRLMNEAIGFTNGR